jgi:hypothetical protein
VVVSFCLELAVGGLSSGLNVVELFVVIDGLKLMSIEKQSGKSILLANALSPIVSEKSIEAFRLEKSMGALWLNKLMSVCSPTSTAATQG